mmetsp:Transcript_4110/g.11435  ORF Transcript_4110/g.11435 Transcript_4110/m.11435 type:complete len:318 (-) Transcript_4110:1276-2229(-)
MPPATSFTSSAPKMSSSRNAFSASSSASFSCSSAASASAACFSNSAFSSSRFLSISASFSVLLSMGFAADAFACDSSLAMAWSRWLFFVSLSFIFFCDCVFHSLTFCRHSWVACCHCCTLWWNHADGRSSSTREFVFLLIFHCFKYSSAFAPLLQSYLMWSNPSLSSGRENCAKLALITRGARSGVVTGRCTNVFSSTSSVTFGGSCSGSSGSSGSSSSSSSSSSLSSSFSSSFFSSSSSFLPAFSASAFFFAASAFAFIASTRFLASFSAFFFAFAVSFCFFSMAFFRFFSSCCNLNILSDFSCFSRNIIACIAFL